MPKTSFSTVRVIYFNQEKVWSALQKLVKKMGRKFPEIEKIVLFGSLAWGGTAPGSDVDLLIILKYSDLSFLNRIPRYLPDQFVVGVDVFPYTGEELEKMTKEGNFFLKRAFGKGIILYERGI